MAASMIIHVRFDLFGDGLSVQSNSDDVSSQMLSIADLVGLGRQVVPILLLTSVYMSQRYCCPLGVAKLIAN